MAFPVPASADEPRAVRLLLPGHPVSIQKFANSASQRVAQSAS